MKSYLINKVKITVLFVALGNNLLCGFHQRKRFKCRNIINEFLENDTKSSRYNGSRRCLFGTLRNL